MNYVVNLQKKETGFFFIDECVGWDFVSDEQISYESDIRTRFYDNNYLKCLRIVDVIFLENTLNLHYNCNKNNKNITKLVQVFTFISLTYAACVRMFKL